MTLKELAARLGVHPSTVSRVANGDPSLRVAAGTRDRIEALLRETAYRPNGIARSLKLRQTFVLGMIVPDVTNPFFAALYRGIEDVSLPRGYNVILCNTDDSPDRERSQLQMLAERRVDGLVLASARLRDPSIRRLRGQGVPHVLVNRFSEPDDPFVGTDDEAGARLVTEHLIACGHRSIGHLSGRKHASTAVLRRRGYERAMAAAGLPHPGPTAESGYKEEGGVRAAMRLLDRPARQRPTAVFAVNDLAALGMYEACRRLDLRIPGDVAVAGYNDIAGASRLEPPLTTIQVPMHEMGATAAGILLDQVEGFERSARRVVFAPQLVVRGSTAPPD